MTERTYQKSISNFLQCTIAAGVVFAATVTTLQADVIAVKGQTPAVGAAIIEINSGQLAYRLKSGRVIAKPIEQIEYLQITNWPLLNLAEKQQRDKHLRQAVNSYEKILAEPPGPGKKTDNLTDENQRTLLIKCRLLRACDALGRFDRAVELYLQIIEAMPTCLEKLRPVNIPALGSMFLESALPKVAAAIEQHGQDPIALSLSNWLDAWPRQQQYRTEPEPADRIKTSGLTPEMKRVRAELPRIDSLIATGKYDKALTHIKSLNNNSAGTLRADLYYRQGRARLGKSETHKTKNDAGRERIRAGLAFMRVVIHFPKHEYAPECLFRTGRICRQLGLNRQAGQLWSELIRDYSNAKQWAESAKKELQRL